MAIFESVGMREVLVCNEKLMAAQWQKKARYLYEVLKLPL